MDVDSKFQRKSSDFIIPETVEDVATSFTKTVIRSLYPGKLIIKGISGKSYIFPHSGSEVEILEQDKDYLLNKNTGKACCGATGYQSLFELVR